MYLLYRRSQTAWSHAFIEEINMKNTKRLLSSVRPFQWRVCWKQGAGGIVKSAWGQWPLSAGGICLLRRRMLSLFRLIKKGVRINTAEATGMNGFFKCFVPGVVHKWVQECVFFYGIRVTTKVHFNKIYFRKDTFNAVSWKSFLSFKRETLKDISLNKLWIKNKFRKALLKRFSLKKIPE